MLIPEGSLAIPNPENHSQWRIEKLQMVNWGGFHGHHTVRFSLESTLVSGGSGSGKSTLIDSYIALMMPSEVPFNGASNEAGGRARSAGQRNLLTYLRGKIGTSRFGDTDELRDNVIRGQNGAHVWGAVAATFISDTKQRFTVMRIYFVKGVATLNSDILTTYGTYEGDFNLADLKGSATRRFDKRELRYQGIITYENLREFQSAFMSRLGIGKDSRTEEDKVDLGIKALKLLARVQGNLEIKRVDDLYKKMVLEKPKTYEKADKAIAHFADLQAVYNKIQDDEEKKNALRQIPRWQEDLQKAEHEINLLADIGAIHRGYTVFQLWSLRHEEKILDDALAGNNEKHAYVEKEVMRLQDEVNSIEKELEFISEQKRKNGGDALDVLNREISDLDRKKHDSYEENSKFADRTKEIILDTPKTAEEFLEAQNRAREFLDQYQQKRKELRQQQKQLSNKKAPSVIEYNALKSERESLIERKNSSVGRNLHEARILMAKVAGLTEQDLPFVAEIIDVLPEEESWRDAIEITLGGFARTVLVDRNNLDHLSRSIEGVQITPRIRFQGVELTRPQSQEWQGNPDYISGKLAFKESWFSSWVQKRISSQEIDYLCVPKPEDFVPDQPCVTPSGQTRDGYRGAYGRSRCAESIIGFSNERRLAEIDAAIKGVQAVLSEFDEQIGLLDKHLEYQDLLKEEHQYVLDQSWEKLDYFGVEAKIDQKRKQREELRSANSILDQLQRQGEELKVKCKQTSQSLYSEQDVLKKLDIEQNQLKGRLDAVGEDLRFIADEKLVAVSEEQQNYLDGIFGEYRSRESLKDFHTNIESLKAQLRRTVSVLESQNNKTVESMQSMFENFSKRWPDNNLGTTAKFADEYRKILDHITEERLYERRQDWREQFARWSSEDLLSLLQTYDEALEEIEDRLDPINNILAHIPFGGKGYLKINCRKLTLKDVREFKKNLQGLSSELAADVTSQQIELRFKRLAKFMEQISIPEGRSRSSTSKRDQLLDVRKHVLITAVCLDENHNEVSTYDSLGDKSGGETQELVAFIVGSALRYQLGDEERSRPRFAPVFLDEGFVKADSQFAGRAVTAWKSLGFQLIVAGPFDKVTSLEPHMDLILTAVKNDQGYSQIVDLPTVKQSEQERG